MIHRFALVGLLVSGAAVAGPCDQAATDQAQLACYDRLASCATRTVAEERLACYRRAGEPLAEAGAASAGIASASAATATATVEEAFPVRGGQFEDGEAPVLSAKVVKTQQNAHKYYYLWLDNGHVWREKEKSRFRYKAGDSITISKGALGSNQLKLEGKSGMVLVERVK